jgi:hypothetical protein
VTTELLDEAPDDEEAIVIAWLKDLHPAGHVANNRKPGGPLPFILVSHLPSRENVEESTADALVSVHVLTHKADGQVASRDAAEDMHRRMLLQARFLEDVELPGGRVASIDYVDVAQPPKRVEYGDENILRRVARYEIGLSYAKVQ